ncbi:MAG TPA: hypothetical protein VFX50_17310, partial [Gemmatimonadales bacterium]|nr:hypothetical protein [Gemmatimonadales bacterium]
MRTPLQDATRSLHVVGSVAVAALALVAGVILWYLVPADDPEHLRKVLVGTLLFGAGCWVAELLIVGWLQREFIVP